MAFWVRGALCAFVMSAMTAGCGGGDSSADATATQAPPQAVRRADAISTQSAADALMNMAEVRYYSYFQGHPTTQASGPFSYRYYPATGVYLGVVTSASAGYTAGDVFVRGGSFGSAPIRIGASTAFLNLVDTSTISFDNGCHDLAGSYTQGSTYTVTRSYSGSLESGTRTFTRTVGQLTQYDGYTAYEITRTIAGNLVQNGTAYTQSTNEKWYAIGTGVGEFTEYGIVSSTSTTRNSATTSYTSTLVDEPPYVERRYRLNPGESTLQTQTYSLTTSYGGSAPSTSQVSNNWIVTYVGRETITVPSGTYETCKYETVTPIGAASTRGSVNTSWVAVGTGITVKDMLVYGGTTTPYRESEVTSIIWNGTPI